MSRMYALGIAPASAGSSARNVLFSSQYRCHFFWMAVKWYATGGGIWRGLGGGGEGGRRMTNPGRMTNDQRVSSNSSLVIGHGWGIRHSLKCGAILVR